MVFFMVILKSFFNTIYPSHFYSLTFCLILHGQSHMVNIMERKYTTKYWHINYYVNNKVREKEKKSYYTALNKIILTGFYIINTEVL